MGVWGLGFRDLGYLGVILGIPFQGFVVALAGLYRVVYVYIGCRDWGSGFPKFRDILFEDLYNKHLGE